MAVAQELKELLKWYLITFGREILILTKDGIKNIWARLFATRNILILGPMQTDKSSLVSFLVRDQPFEVVDGERHAPNPTAAAAIVNEKFKAQRDQWLKTLSQDSQHSCLSILSRQRAARKPIGAAPPCGHGAGRC
jgi:hypothetical protein